MNANSKTHLAAALTTIVTIIAVIQTSLTTPPFNADTVVIAGAILAFLSLSLTALKQYFSAEVNNSGIKVTLWVAGVTVLGGVGNLINIFHVSDTIQHYITWGISVSMAVLTILSRQIFPSNFQQVKNDELRQITPENTAQQSFYKGK